MGERRAGGRNMEGCGVAGWVPIIKPPLSASSLPLPCCFYLVSVLMLMSWYTGRERHTELSALLLALRVLNCFLYRNYKKNTCSKNNGHIKDLDFPSLCLCFTPFPSDLSETGIWRGVIAPFGQQMSLVGSEGDTTHQHMLKKYATGRGKRE